MTNEANSSFPVKLKLLDGSQKSLLGSSDMTVAALRTAVLTKLDLSESFNQQHLRLIHSGRVLDDDSKTLSDYHIMPESANIHVVVRPRTVSPSTSNNPTAATTANDSGSSSGATSRHNRYACV